MVFKYSWVFFLVKKISTYLCLFVKDVQFDLYFSQATPYLVNLNWTAISGSEISKYSADIQQKSVILQSY
jgi:hypothetical protein